MKMRYGTFLLFFLFLTAAACRLPADELDAEKDGAGKCPLEFYDTAAVYPGESFTLGPFSRKLLPVPVELDINLENGRTGRLYEVVELDSGGKEAGVYPCMLFESEGRFMVRFLPFSDESFTEWEAGKERRFLIRETLAHSETLNPLMVEREQGGLRVTGRYYSVVLEEPRERLEGSAREIIKEISFPGSGKSFFPSRTSTDMRLDGASYHWQFDPLIPASLRRVDGHIVNVEYGGRFGSPGADPRIDTLRWRLGFTFYGGIPLVRVNVRIEQSGEARDRFDLCRFLQIHFNPSDEDVPLRHVSRIEGGRRGFNDLLAAHGEGAFLGMINRPYNMTTGTVWKRQPPTSAFIVGIWESNAVMAETVADSVFYYIISDDVAVEEDMDDYWWSLSELLEIEERIKIRRLFD